MKANRAHGGTCDFGGAAQLAACGSHTPPVAVPPHPLRSARRRARDLLFPTMAVLVAVVGLCVATPAPAVAGGPARASADDDQAPAESLANPSCPDGICPGLGNSFYLPAINGFASNTGGNIFFVKRRLGDCATLSREARTTRDFQSVESMEQFTRTTMSAFDLSARYTTARLTVSGTAQAMTGSRSDITSTFNSTHMDVTTTTHVVNFDQSGDCFSADNVDPRYLAQFTALALIDRSQVGSPSAWQPYVSFMTTWGSHVMMQQQIGSRFQKWESSTTNATDILNTLKAKACAVVEGTAGTGWSVQACSAYSREERERAQRVATSSQQIVLGGTLATRTALTQGVTKETLDAFIASASRGDQAIRFTFKPIWELFFAIYSPACKEQGQGSVACQHLQRAVNLQAAYEGWTAIGCDLQRDGRGSVYQSMAIAGTTSLGIDTYECVADKTGCRSHNDCRVWGFACYCRGASCIDQGQPIPGTDLHRNRVRGSREGGSGEGVNNSCNYHANSKCYCDTSWAGGLPRRSLYLQAAP